MPGQGSASGHLPSLLLIADRYLEQRMRGSRVEGLHIHKEIIRLHAVVGIFYSMEPVRLLSLVATPWNGS